MGNSDDTQRYIFSVSFRNGADSLKGEIRGNGVLETLERIVSEQNGMPVSEIDLMKAGDRKMVGRYLDPWRATIAEAPDGFWEIDSDRRTLSVDGVPVPARTAPEYDLIEA